MPRRFSTSSLPPAPPPMIFKSEFELYHLIFIALNNLFLCRVLQRHPGFPQAEHLYYPLDICRRLAAYLKESNSAYPEGMRTMTGLDVGWLQRV